MAYYIYIQNEQLNGCGQCRQLTEGVTNLEVEESLYNAYAENPEMYIWDGEAVVEDPEYNEKQEAKEKARIQELFMTRSDFFDGTIQAWGVGQDELLILIQNLLATLPIEDVKKLMAINNFKNALNFYRKHDLFKMLVGVPIQLAENVQLVIEDEYLDKFFDEVDKGNKETAWQYLPSPVLIPIETDVNNSEEVEEETPIDTEVETEEV